MDNRISFIMIPVGDKLVLSLWGKDPRGSPG